MISATRFSVWAEAGKGVDRARQMVAMSAMKTDRMGVASPETSMRCFLARLRDTRRERRLGRRRGLRASPLPAGLGHPRMLRGPHGAEGDGVRGSRKWRALSLAPR